MKKIVMTKYGFERWPEEDFSDDGNRFTCYKVGTRVRISKLVSQGQVYICARIDGVKLPYEEFAKLPSYKELDRLNGISLSSLTEDDLVRLYNACVRYEQEYIDAENSVVFPTLEEITNHCKAIQIIRQNEITVVEHLIKTNITEILIGLSDYQWKNLKYYYENLIREADHYDESTYPQKIVGTRQSFEFCKVNSYTKQESFYYTRIVELIKKVIKL